ncbi:hypothetical protein BGX34_008543 [Mortierella sp. NVP85]|nr:hypothetical protein BGX34_008543 [Mortierella sp. NVP85]
MSYTNPLEIPEITGLVASYLEGKDLAHCVQVSKKWRDLLLPYRWKTVNVGAVLTTYPSRQYPRRRFGPHPSDIYRHRHLIHDLTLTGETNGLENCNYPNLRKLDLSLLGAEDFERELFLELTEPFPSLVSLCLQSLKLASPSWLSLSAHPRVTELILCDMAVKAADEPLFWVLCERLETLSFFTVIFDNGTIPAEGMFDRLRVLDVSEVENIALSAQMDLILRCPNLK